MEYDSLMALVRSRRSVRAFADRPVERADIERLVEAARWAPSGHNRQGWKFVVFDERRELRELGRRVRASLSERLASAGRLAPGHADHLLRYATLFAGAPCAILAMHKRAAAIGRDLLGGATDASLASGEPLSTAMAVQNLLLAAHALGLGACVTTAPLLAGEVWRAVSDLPKGFEPTCVVAVGHPAEDPEPPRRKELDKIVEYRCRHD